MFSEATIGEKIKYYRNRASLSQLDLEVSADLAVGHLSRIENDLINPTKETIMAISQILKLKESEILHLFNLLNTNVGNENEGFVSIYNSDSTISYGKFSLSPLKIKVKFHAHKSNIDKYYYYNANSTAEFQRISGFLEKDDVSKAIREFDSWDGTIGKGVFINLHRITLPIQPLSESKSIDLSYQVNLMGTYVELVKNNIPTPHFYFTRIIYPTLSFNNNIKIPNGKKSWITELMFIVEYKSEEIMEYTTKWKANTIKLPEKFGDIHIEIDDKNTYINWTSNQSSLPGTMYKVRWDTIPK